MLLDCGTFKVGCLLSGMMAEVQTGVGWVKREEKMNEFVKRVGDFVDVGTGKFYKATLFRAETLLIGLNCLEPGQVQQPHVHDDQDKFYYVVEGDGRFWLGEDQVTATAGELVWAPAGLHHGVENSGHGRLTLLVGIAPAP
jgi:mannose-6-phosphate isomerase-like protein (cupin superfamily)